MTKQIFFVAITAGADAVVEKIQENFPEEDTYKLAKDKWFLVFNGISRELAENLQIRSTPNIGTGIVLPVESYSGRAPTQLWEWLKLQMERQ